jgi:two-component system, response regulator, stage 0 sporulation protein F
MRHGKGKYVCSVGNWSYEGDWLDDRRVSHTDMQKEHGSVMAGKKKILIVDDQMGIRLLLQEVFKNGGYDAYQASSAKEAMAMVKKVAPDLIIHDLVMPDVDGWESIDRMLQYNAGLKIMAISAYWPDDKPNAIFTKPFDIDEFMSFVNGVLNGTVALGSPYREAPVGKGSYG